MWGIKTLVQRSVYSQYNDSKTKGTKWSTKSHIHWRGNENSIQLLMFWKKSGSKTSTEKNQLWRWLTWLLSLYLPKREIIPQENEWNCLFVHFWSPQTTSPGHWMSRELDFVVEEAVQTRTTSVRLTSRDIAMILEMIVQELNKSGTSTPFEIEGQFFEQFYIVKLDCLWHWDKVCCWREYNPLPLPLPQPKSHHVTSDWGSWDVWARVACFLLYIRFIIDGHDCVAAM
jgi:hypothetical protein